MKYLSHTLIAAIAVSVMASGAQASQRSEEIGEENAVYFHKFDKAASPAHTATQNQDYGFATTPQERNAMRDDAYWSKNDHSAAQSSSTGDQSNEGYATESRIKR